MPKGPPHRQNRGKGAYPERCVGRNRDVVLAGLLRGEAHVAAGLPRDMVAYDRECAGKLNAAQVPRKARAHAAIISSRT